MDKKPKGIGNQLPAVMAWKLTEWEVKLQIDAEKHWRLSVAVDIAAKLNQSSKRAKAERC